MNESQTILSVTIDGEDEADTDVLLAKFESCRQGEVERTRDFGASIAIAASLVALVKAIVEVWHSIRPPKDAVPAAPASNALVGKRAAVTIEARDGAILSLPEVRDQREIERFVHAHAGPAKG